jgi:hypothetical protein
MNCERGFCYKEVQWRGKVSSGIILFVRGREHWFSEGV